MAAGDIYRLRLAIRVNNIPCYTYFHFKNLRGISKAVNLCELWTSAASTEWSSFSFMIGNSCKFLGAQAKQITGGGMDIAEVPAAPTLFGGAVGTVLPTDNCMLVNWKCAAPSRRRRGWNMINGIVAERHQGGYATTTQQNNVKSWIQGIMDRYGPTGSGVNWRFGIYSYTLGGPYPNGNPAAWFQVVSGSVSPIVTRNEKKARDEAYRFDQPYI